MKKLHVHGDIRHLEKQFALDMTSTVVHGDIRHLEIAIQTLEA